MFLPDLRLRGACLGCALWVAACASPLPEPAPPAAPTATPNPAPLPPPAQPEAPSALSYGLVTSQVRKGETTQLELVQLFGSPNITSYDTAGIETWVYERTATQTDVQARSEAARGAANLGAFFGSGSAGASVEGGRSASTGTARTSVRSITVIVKFAPDKTVSDYSVRASYF